MEAIWTSVVAVGGTLLGSVITHVFQRLSARRTEQFTRSEALRQEWIATYTAFAAAVEDYRHGQAARWYRKAADPDGEPFREARDEAHRLRTVARQALYRVKLLTDEAGVARAAELAYRRTQEISYAEEQQEHSSRDQQAREAIEAFVSTAAPLVR
ncbi:hypothetical protein ITI46_31995 [Streptomyces oryzae]|uniref:Secreted protein n=1 Tax=Streptomyces oryzae TaxID=1434886 RepID=A0ABS3XLM0_9ACTN|nr:hypothetical protein [Streptomyces oryzae]MBO8196231.1 hypothetical protein [Streptomyces oryzae]